MFVLTARVFNIFFYIRCYTHKVKSLVYVTWSMSAFNQTDSCVLLHFVVCVSFFLYIFVRLSSISNNGACLVVLSLLLLLLSVRHSFWPIHTSYPKMSMACAWLIWLYHMQYNFWFRLLPICTLQIYQKWHPSIDTYNWMWLNSEINCHFLFHLIEFPKTLRFLFVLM